MLSSKQRGFTTPDFPKSEASDDTQSLPLFIRARFTNLPDQFLLLDEEDSLDFLLKF